MKYSRRSPYHPVQIPLGFVFWSLWFISLYGGLSVVCAIAPPDPAHGPWTWLNGALGLFTLVTAAVMAWLAWRFHRLSKQDEELNERQRFVTRVTSYGYTVAVIATLFIGVPLLQLPPCL